MSLAATALVWCVLMLLLGAQFFAGPAAAPALSALMAALVALTFMRLARTPGIAGAFALAALFWLVVMAGLTATDTLTRRDIAVQVQTETALGDGVRTAAQPAP